MLHEQGADFDPGRRRRFVTPPYIIDTDSIS